MALTPNCPSFLLSAHQQMHFSRTSYWFVKQLTGKLYVLKILELKIFEVKRVFLMASSVCFCERRAPGQEGWRDGHPMITACLRGGNLGGLACVSRSQ